MADIKRTRYFDQQLLILRDFTDEQSYHVEMRRRHNRLLHTAGVADGLDVTKTGVNEVTVIAGMALDNQGREVVLDADTKIDLSNATSSPPNSSVLITINYEQSETDPYASDTNQNTRVKEAGRVALFKEGVGTAPDSSAVQLARVTFDAKGAVDNVDLSVRRQAGSSAFDKSDAAFTVRSLRLSNPAFPKTQWPSLTASDSNQVTIGGGLVVQGLITTVSDLNANRATIGSTLNVNNDLIANRATIKTALSVTGDLVVGVTGAPSKLQVSGPIVPSVGNSAGAGIQFPSNPGGGSGDEAYIRYFVTSGEATRLQIGVGNDPDDAIGLVQAGAERLTITNGNVGIGTPTPDAPLRVKQSVNALAFKVTANRGGSDGYKQPIAEFRNDNETLGVGIGYASIFPTGGTNLDLAIFARGDGALVLNRDGGSRVIVEKSLQVNGTISSTKWKITQLFNSTQGPLPLSTKSGGAPLVTGGGTLVIFAAGSGSATFVGAIGMRILIDGFDRGAAICWTNETQSHKAFVANALVVPGISAGQHILALDQLGDTSTDKNDFFSVTVLEMPW